MNLENFYFGALEESDRLKIEQELLTDTETLVEYLDLKRKIEFAKEIPAMPSPSLWRRLQAEIKPRRKLILSLSLAAGLAASVLIAAMFLSNKTETTSTPLLFDSTSELSASSNVL